MGKITIKRVGVLSSGKITAAFCGILGIIFVSIFAAISLTLTILDVVLSDGDWTGILVGGGFGLLMIVLYAVMGFISGCLYALIYNLAAKYLGGIEVEAE